MRHVVQDVLKLNASSEDELNVCIYLLDKNQLPLDETGIVKKNVPFCLIYKQMTEILDDSNDFDCECYYLTAELHQFLQWKLESMVIFKNRPFF